jgi:hypothetical protein
MTALGYLIAGVIPSSIWALLAQRLVKTVNIVERLYPLKLEYFEAGFNKFAERYEQNGITGKLR